MNLEVFEFYTIFITFICYIYGSIPFAYVFTYLFQKVRLSEKGTGNIGVANAFGVGGLRAGFLTVIGEATKAALPIYLSFYFYSSDPRASIIFLSASILGTSYSVFLGGRGSQGGTVFLWGLLFLSPFTFLLFMGMFLPTFLLLRRRYITSIVAHALLPLEIYLVEGDVSLVIFGALAALFYSLRYKPQASDYAYYNKDMRLLRFTKKIIKEKEDLVFDISKVNNQSQVGMKAWGLRQLERIGLKIPKTYVCPFTVYKEYTRGNKKLLSGIRLNLEKILKQGIPYCVRSSANVEDERDYSFAGQFESYLNITSIDEIENKMLNIWQSTNSQKVNAYISRIGIPIHNLKMAVIIQEMVSVKYSGVVFTKNPINGFDEVIIELVQGSSSLLLQNGVTPERWVYKWGIWKERPNDSHLDISIVGRIVREAKYAEKKFGAPVDMEWTYDGKSLYWLQIRKITTVSGISIYSNRISKGFLPGIVKPLIWTVNTKVVNTAWKNIFIELIGRGARDIDIDRLTKSFYGRAYFNMGIIGDIFELIDMPRELLELLLGLSVPGDSPPKFRPGKKAVKYLPRIIPFIMRRLFYTYRINRFLVQKDKSYEQYTAVKVTELSEKEAIKIVEQLVLLDIETSYHVIMSQLLMGFYNMLLNRMLSKKGISVKNLQFIELKKYTEDIDPYYQLEQLRAIYLKLHSPISQNSPTPNISQHKAFQTEFNDFLHRFGHLSDSGNDFSKTQWREKPGFVLDMIAEQGLNGREIPSDTRIDSDSNFMGFFTRLIYKRTIKFMIIRQRVNFLYEYGYSLFRPYILQLAELFVEDGFLDNAEDIFYLTFDELRNIVASETISEVYKHNIVERKQELMLGEGIGLPEIIIGDEKPPIIMGHHKAKTLEGIAASGGYCSGKIKLIRNISDFIKVKEGDIIVIPHSDISWTPILVKAQAIISESGGILSHCAIVAREHKIPAVVSVPRAMQLLEGSSVKVDGYVGEITLFDPIRKNK